MSDVGVAEPLMSGGKQDEGASLSVCRVLIPA